MKYVFNYVIKVEIEIEIDFVQMKSLFIKKIIKFIPLILLIEK